ncbi:MAG: formimidoylglutamase [Chitinophagaceae bacterium]|nr:formimidoylglutamase [Chitinophagaceae bacterium]
MATYQHADPALWNGRTDGDTPDQLRWHQVMHCLDIEKEPLPLIGPHHQGVAFIGFCSDEGVRRNQGRTGAAAAPRFIREACKNLPLVGSHIILADAGDIVCDTEDLELAQERLGNLVATVRAANYLPIVMGGGHEVAWGNFLGIRPHQKKQEFGIVNFDAHFDLRQPLSPSGTNSGTGIWQMHEWCMENGHPFHYLAIGIQQYANTRRLFETADDMGARYFLAEEFTNDHLEKLVTAINAVMANSDILQLTIDMDVFAACHAPGVSALSYNGIAPNAMFKRLLRHIVFSGKVWSVDIAELNPRYDIDSRTARLAASLIFDIVQAADKNAEYPG